MSDSIHKVADGGAGSPSRPTSPDPLPGVREAADTALEGIDWRNEPKAFAAKAAIESLVAAAERADKYQRMHEVAAKLANDLIARAEAAEAKADTLATAAMEYVASIATEEQLMELASAIAATAGEARGAGV